MAPERLDLEAMRAKHDSQAKKSQQTQKIEHPDGRTETRQKGSEALTSLESARAGKGAQFPTFVSKVKRLLVMMSSGGKVVVGTQVVETAPSYIQFENQLYICKNQKEADFLLKGKGLGRHYWTKADFQKMQDAETTRKRDEATRHLNLVKLEMDGGTDPAHPDDAALAVGMQAGPDKATENPNVATDADGLPELLPTGIEDGG